MVETASIDTVIERALPDPTRRKPARAEELRLMHAATPLPIALRTLYAAEAELLIGEVEVFEPAIFVDVNTDREGFGALSGMTYFAADRAEGFFFIDTDDTLGLGEGFVYWVDRGLMGADDVVPCGPDIASFLADVQAGARPWDSATLGQRAIERLRAVVATNPKGIDFRPGIDPGEFGRNMSERGLSVTYATGEILKIANGMYFTATGRQIHPLSRQIGMLENRIVLIGHDPALGNLGVTRGDWQDLPADRLIAFDDMDHPELGKLLGRVADVLTFWIEEAAGS